MSLQSKITLAIAAILLLSASVTLTLNSGILFQGTDRAVAHNLTDVAKIVSVMPPVVQGLGRSHEADGIQEAVATVTAATDGVDQIMICDMHRIIRSHTDTELLGLVHTGDDVKEALNLAQSYVITVQDEAVENRNLGLMLRAYMPIFSDGEQIGVIAAGIRKSRLWNEKAHLMLSATVFALAGLCIGLIGAIILAHKAKDTLLGLEPDEITQLYREHMGLIEAMHEGVVAINSRGRVSMTNKSARALLGLGDDQLQGLEIDRIMPGTRLPNVISTGQAEFDFEMRMNGKVLIANMVPVLENGRVVGAVETFQDKTLIIRMAEELIGIRHLVEALRASSHEFSNKLHVILGMLELGEYERAKQFIQETQQEHGKLHKQLLQTFRDPMIAGLMLGKFSVGKEQGVDLVVTPESRVDLIKSSALSHSLVVILGNLVDNAMEAARGNVEHNGCVSVDIRQADGSIAISVEDNGTGVEPENFDAIFRRGFSTKGKGRGTGLHLVRQEIELLGGSIAVESVPGRTVFTAVVPETDIGE